MHPIFLQIGPVTIYSYGVMLALGAGLGLWVLTRLARKSGLDAEKVSSLALWCLISGLIGTRLAFIALEPSHFLQDPLSALAIWQGGLVFYGAAAAVPVGWWLARRFQLPWGPVLDCAAPAAALGQAVGRIGCFLAGCCHGRVWEGGFLAVVFDDPHTLAPPHVELHPSQLYSSVTLFAIFALLIYLWPRKKFVGQIFFFYGLLHGTARVIIEQFRGDFRGEAVLGDLTPTGLFALVFALFSAGMLIYLYRRNQMLEGE